MILSHYVDGEGVKIVPHIVRWPDLVVGCAVHPSKFDSLVTSVGQPRIAFAKTLKYVKASEVRLTRCLLIVAGQELDEVGGIDVLVVVRIPVVRSSRSQAYSPRNTPLVLGPLVG